MMADDSLLDFDSFEQQMSTEEKKELRCKTKSEIMSLFKNGPQLVGLSDPLLVSSVNMLYSSDIADISEFDPGHSTTVISAVKAYTNLKPRLNGIQLAVRITNIQLVQDVPLTCNTCAVFYVY